MSEISNMNIKFKQIDITNYNECIDLKLSEEQNKYGHLQLYTSAEVDNPVAIGLYAKLGFQNKKCLNMNRVEELIEK